MHGCNKRRLVVLASLVVLTAAGASVQLASGASAQGPPLPTVQSAADIGKLTQDPRILARDAAFSASMNGVNPGSDGGAAWVFGDTMMSTQGADCDTFDSNTRAWSGIYDASGGIQLGFDDSDSAGVPTEFLPLTNAEIW